MESLQIKIVPYAEEADTIHAIRSAVFQKEQNVDPTHDFDGKDANATQLLAYWEGQPVGTIRYRALDMQVAKIERLAVLPSARGKGIGSKLMQAALEQIANQGFSEVVIHAQDYIKDLHKKLGFEQVGDRFDEAGIAHVKMVKKLR